VILKLLETIVIFLFSYHYFLSLFLQLLFIQQWTFTTSLFLHLFFVQQQTLPSIHHSMLVIGNRQSALKYISLTCTMNLWTCRWHHIRVWNSVYLHFADCPNPNHFIPWFKLGNICKPRFRFANQIEVKHLSNNCAHMVEYMLLLNKNSHVR
jgi:hypothetical protein